MSMRRMMEVNTTTVVVESTATKVDPTHPPGFNQVNRPASDMVGQGGETLGSTGGPHFVQVQNKHSFPPYGLPPNYTPPNVAHTPDENVNNFAPIPIESQQPQFGHAQVPLPMGGHMKYPETTLYPTLSLTSDMPLRDRHFVVYPCQTLWGASVSPTTTTLTFCSGKSTSCYGGKGKIRSYRRKAEGYLRRWRLCFC